MLCRYTAIIAAVDGGGEPDATRTPDWILACMNNQPNIFLSYVLEDRSWADQCAAFLRSIGASVHTDQSLITPGEEFQRRLQEAILQTTHILVLIGPRTRLSQWVDREIELGTESRDDGPGAGVVGIILPSHEDFSRPYYDPENVPVRLHDLIQNEYAILRKWTESPDELSRWLEDAERRRYRHRPEPSLGAAVQLRRFSWDAKVDESLPDLEPR